MFCILPEALYEILKSQSTHHTFEAVEAPHIQPVQLTEFYLVSVQYLRNFAANTFVKATDPSVIDVFLLSNNKNALVLFTIYSLFIIVNLFTYKISK